MRPVLAPVRWAVRVALLSAPAALAQAEPVPGPTVDWPAARVVGRVVLDDVGGQTRLRAAWPGVAVGVRFRGEGLVARLQDVSQTASPPPVGEAAGWRSHWQVDIDGRPTQVVVAPAGGDVLRLAGNLGPGEHTLWLTKLTEAMLGPTWLWGVQVDAGGQLLPPPAPRARRLEVVGASNETGYGVENTNCSGYRPAEQNQNHAWPQLLARRLGAELMNTAYSGKGLARNHPAAGDPDLTLPALYGRSDPGDPNSPWDSRGWQADAVVIDLGGNDWSGFGGVPDRQIFEPAMVSFVQAVRARYPSAHIFVALNGSFSPPERGLQAGMLQRAVARARAAGDLRLSYFAFSQDRTPAVRRGCDGHPSAGQHARMAAELAPRLARTLGWPVPRRS